MELRRRLEGDNSRQQNNIQQSLEGDALGAAGGEMERTSPAATLYYGEKESASSERSGIFKGAAGSSSRRVQSSGANRHAKSRASHRGNEEHSGSRETETLMGNGANGGSLPINPRYGSIGGACGGPGAGTAEGGDSVSGLRSRAVTREEPTFREDGERHDPGPVRREQQQGEEPGERF